MTNRLLWYLAAPIGGDVSGNVARLLRWYRWAVLAYPQRLIVVPYLADVLAFDDNVPGDRAAGFERNRQHLTAEIDGGIMLVGGRVSAGMESEVGMAKSVGLAVDDLTHLGPEPPTVVAAPR